MVIAKAGRPLQEEKTISSARSKRHGKGARLSGYHICLLGFFIVIGPTSQTAPAAEEPLNLISFTDDLREPSSLPAIKTNDEQNKENNLQNIEIVQENVKTLESALNEVIFDFFIRKIWFIQGYFSLSTVIAFSLYPVFDFFFQPYPFFSASEKDCKSEQWE